MKSDERVRLLSLGKNPLKCDVKGLPSTTDPGFKLASTSPNNEFLDALYKRRLEKNRRNNNKILIILVIGIITTKL